MPNPGEVSCIELACPEPNCPAGYVPGDALGGCCHDCVPDPLYCASDADCVVADRPRGCCGCAEAISVRALDDDPCWFTLDNPRQIPEDCYPEAYCDAVCGACLEISGPACIDNRCTTLTPTQ
jgi:hypothetical protein